MPASKRLTCESAALRSRCHPTWIHRQAPQESTAGSSYSKFRRRVNLVNNAP
ncbi:hypothetical protein [Kibdelosporangium philippinense]|uniref:hypothetical protein n=1 Tax=Kibdelosporangium philippinense TaxID=211113 RepID=UPI003607D5C8